MTLQNTINQVTPLCLCFPPQVCLLFPLMTPKTTGPLGTLLTTSVIIASVFKIQGMGQTEENLTKIKPLKSYCFCDQFNEEKYFLGLIFFAL